MVQGVGRATAGLPSRRRMKGSRHGNGTWGHGWGVCGVCLCLVTLRLSLYCVGDGSQHENAVEKKKDALG